LLHSRAAGHYDFLAFFFDFFAMSASSGPMIGASVLN